MAVHTAVDPRVVAMNPMIAVSKFQISTANIRHVAYRTVDDRTVADRTVDDSSVNFCR